MPLKTIYDCTGVRLYYTPVQKKLQGGIFVVSVNAKNVTISTEKTKIKKESDEKNSYWLTILYPESAEEGWKDILCERGAMALVSPLHDKDVNATGEPKKAHYHVILMWPKPTTYSNALKAAKLIGGVGCRSALTLRGSARYLCHLDNPEKAQYDIEDVLQFGGVDYLDIINSTSDDDLELSKLYQHIKDNSCTSFLDLVIWCNINNRRWLHLINHKYRENVWKALRSNEYNAKQDLSLKYQAEMDALLQHNQQIKDELQRQKELNSALSAMLGIEDG